jgi:16S rRNA (adenine1518-N6/adenine1519-N6)-dimethyltransferase
MLTQIELLKKYGLTVRGHVGQHLLIDGNLQRKTVDLLELVKTDKVLEIGPGLGALTGHLLASPCERFVAVEKDPQFVEVLKQEYPAFAEKKNQLVHENILDFDFKTLGAARAGWKVISNLPYYITAPILFRLLDHRTLFSTMVFTMQKEVADRILASPGSKDYGRLTLAMRYAVNARHAFDIPASCFTPRPAVASSVVVLEVNPENRLLKEADEKLLFHIIQIAFSQRRKMFISLLAADSSLGKSRSELLGIFERCGIPETSRGEALLLKDYLQLLEALKAAAPLKNLPKAGRKG